MHTLPETLDIYFEENLGDFLMGNIRHIDVQRITHRPKYATGYGMKGLKRPTFSEDDVLVLPRDVSELPHENLRYRSCKPSLPHARAWGLPTNVRYRGNS